MSNGTIFKITVQGIVDKRSGYIYLQRHYRILKTCLLNQEKLKQTRPLLKKLTVRTSKAKRNKLETHD